MKCIYDYEISELTILYSSVLTLATPRYGKLITVKKDKQMAIKKRRNALDYSRSRFDRPFFKTDPTLT